MVYFCPNTAHLKYIFYLLAFSVSVISCNNSSPAAAQPADSLQFTASEPGAIAEKERKALSQKLETFFNERLIGKGFNGSILVAKEGNILYEKYEGYRDLRKKDALTDTTAFHLASTSKPFTGMAILWLVQQGKLSLDDSVQKFFPALPYPGVSVKLLLNHRSGIPNYVYFMDDKKLWDKSRFVTNPDVMAFIYQHKPPRSFKPDTRFSYSNTNYVLLANIVEKVTGKPFPEFLKENLFGPLEMNHTYVYTLADSSRSTHSFDARGGFWKDDFLEGTYGDKNVYSTPRDMLKWDQALYTGRFIRQSLLDSAFTPYSNETKSIHNYGLGWRLLMLPNGKKVVYHFGRWHGFTPAFARLVDEKATIIILGNKFNRNIYNSAHKAYDIFGAYLQDENDGEEAENVQEKQSPVKKSPEAKLPPPPPKKPVSKKGK
ncbi:MAG: class A beta-lactamase-related serine hydrolase [Chitinophagaceae bacterium]|nr:MAG: class A beta-lactamase-related serine hydrolase [Chitinophagaceae bacterium]